MLPFNLQKGKLVTESLADWQILSYMSVLSCLLHDTVDDLAHTMWAVREELEMQFSCRILSEYNQYNTPPGNRDPRLQRNRICLSASNTSDIQPFTQTS